MRQSVPQASRTHKNGAATSSFMNQLQTDYSEIMRADDALHKHLGNLMQHMQQWIDMQHGQFHSMHENGQMYDDGVAKAVKENGLYNGISSTPDKRDNQTPRLPAAVLMADSPLSREMTLLSERSADTCTIGALRKISKPIPESVGDSITIGMRAAPLKTLEPAEDSPLKDDVTLDGIVLDEVPMQESMGLMPLAQRSSPAGCSSQLPEQTVEHEQSFMAWEDVPHEKRMWCQIIDLVLETAKKKRFYELRDTWIMPETSTAKVLRANPDVDFKILVRPQDGSKSWADRPQSRHTHAHPPINKQHTLSMFSRSTIPRRRSTRRMGTVPEYKRNKSWMSRRYIPREGEQCCYVLDPQAPIRLAWMGMGMVLMLYDLIVLPMQAFDLPDHPFLTIMNIVGQTFWTIDIPVTFLTAVYVNCELCKEFRMIAREYMRSWLLFDFSVVISLWIVLAIGTDEGTGNAGMVRYVRMMRFLRLARLAKFQHYLEEALASVNSSSLILCVGIFKLMTLMIIVSHLNACIWYAVGNAYTGGWVKAYEGTSWFYRYLTSMHWAFTQFQGTSDILPAMGGEYVLTERAYAVVIVMAALILLSSFVSSLTNMMMQLQALREERMGMARSVREYLGSNDVSKSLSVRVKKYIDWKQQMQRKLGSSDRVLQMLPLALQIDLQEEVRGPTIVAHRFFYCLKVVHLRVFRIICHQVLGINTPAPGELVFSQQDHAARMYFVIAGTSRYLPQTSTAPGAGKGEDDSAKIRRTMNSMARLENSGKGKSKKTVQKIEDEESDEEEIDYIQLETGAYLCEPTLWTSWEHCGILVGVSAAQFVNVETALFDSHIKHHPPAHVSATLYARQFVAGLNKFGKSFNDIIDIADLMEDETKA